MMKRGTRTTQKFAPASLTVVNRHFIWRFLYSRGLLTSVKLNVVFQSVARFGTKFASGGTDTS